MIKLLRYLFVVQYDYRDPAQATRARMLVPFISTIAILLLILGVFLLGLAVTGDTLSDRNTAMSGAAVPVLIVLMLAVLWLTQTGYVRIGAAIISALLWAMAGVSLLLDGVAPVAVLTIPFVLTYFGLLYGTRGIVLTLALVWVALPVTAYLQSEGTLNAAEEPLDDLLPVALSSTVVITVTALSLWFFAWNFQQVLTRSMRAATLTRNAATVGQSLSRILNMQELLPQAVDLIRDRFAFYHVQIFLVDDVYANLAASTGEIGSALLAQGYRVPVNGRTVVGDTIANNQMCYVPDITATAYHHSEMLADTRSELAIPLVVGNQVAGALDVQSVRPHAFGEEEIEAMQIMANQIGQTMQNAQLFESQQQGLLQNRRLFLESETNLREIERLNRRLTGQSWQEYLLERGEERLGVHIVGEEVQAGPVEWTPAMRQAAERHRIVSQDDGSEHVLAVPISIRGQSIGAVEVRLAGPHNQSEVRNIIQAVVERMAFSLENARLFEQAHMAAEREQQINQITSQLQGLTAVDDVLTTAISTLGQALGASEGTIRIAARDAGIPGSNGSQDQNEAANEHDTQH